VVKQSSTSTSAMPLQRQPAPSSMDDLEITAIVVAGLLDVTPDGLLMIDGSGCMVLVNSRIEDMFGYRRSDLVRRPVEILLPEALHAAHRAHRERYAADPRTRRMGSALSLRGRRRDGSEFPVDISLSPLRTGKGQWVIAAVRNDEPRQQSEQQRLEAAVVDEQDRIADGLIDTVVRGLFGTGLRLQGLLERSPEEMRAGIEESIESIDATIREVRAAVFGLRRDDRVP